MKLRIGGSILGRFRRLKHLFDVRPGRLFDGHGRALGLLQIVIIAKIDNEHIELGIQATLWLPTN